MVPPASSSPYCTSCAWYYVYKSFKVVNGWFSLYAVNAMFSLLTVNGLFALLGVNSAFSILSIVSGHVDTLFVIINFNRYFLTCAYHLLFSWTNLTELCSLHMQYKFIHDCRLCERCIQDLRMIWVQCSRKNLCISYTFCQEPRHETQQVVMCAFAIKSISVNNTMFRYNEEPLLYSKNSRD